MCCRGWICKTTSNYIDEIDAAVAEDWKENEKSQKPREDVNEEKEIKVSKTNPDCEYMIRDGKQEGSHYRCS